MKIEKHGTGAEGLGGVSALSRNSLEAPTLKIEMNVTQRTESEQMRRFAKDAGHYPVIEFLDRWGVLPPYARDRLNEKWDREDAADKVR